MPTYAMQYVVSELDLNHPLFELFHFRIRRDYGNESFIDKWYIQKPNTNSYCLAKNGEWTDRYDDDYRNSDNRFNEDLWNSRTRYDTVEEAYDIAIKCLPNYKVNGNTLKDAIAKGFVG